MARLCRELSRDAVVLTGWDHLVEAIELHEGEPVTGVTLAIANELDLAFEKGRQHEPYVTIGLHTDEAYAFSTATPADLIAECEAAEGAPGRGARRTSSSISTPQAPARSTPRCCSTSSATSSATTIPAEAPMRYVDYVIGCWWRALRFQQAVAADIAGSVCRGDPGGRRHGRHAARARLRARLRAPEAPVVRRAETIEMGEISAADFIQRKAVGEEEELAGTGLRRRRSPARSRRSRSRKSRACCAGCSAGRARSTRPPEESRLAGPAVSARPACARTPAVRPSPAEPAGRRGRTKAAVTSSPRAHYEAAANAFGQRPLLAPLVDETHLGVVAFGHHRSTGGERSSNTPLSAARSRPPRSRIRGTAAVRVRTRARRRRTPACR